MSIRTSRLIAILFITAMIVIAGVSANSDRKTQDTKRKKQKTLATKRAQRNSRKPPKPTDQLFQPVQEKDGDDGIEDVNGRDDWFLFQRKYPFDSIPDDARKRAYELRPAELLGPDVLSWQLIGTHANNIRLPE